MNPRPQQHTSSLEHNDALPEIGAFHSQSTHLRVHRIDNNYFPDPVTKVQQYRWFKGNAQAKQFHLGLQRQFKEKRAWLAKRPEIVDRVSATYDNCMTQRRNRLVQSRWDYLWRIHCMMQRGWVTDQEAASLFTQPLSTPDGRANQDVIADDEFAHLQNQFMQSNYEAHNNYASSESKQDIRQSCKVSLATLEQALLRVTLGGCEIRISQFLYAVQDAFSRCRTNMSLFTVYGLRKGYGPLHCLTGLFKSFVACNNLLFGEKIYEFDFRSSTMDIRTLLQALSMLCNPLQPTESFLRQSFLKHSRIPEFDAKQAVTLLKLSKYAQEQKYITSFRIVLDLVTLCCGTYKSMKDVKQRAVTVWKSVVPALDRLKGTISCEVFMKTFVTHESFQGLFDEPTQDTLEKKEIGSSTYDSNSVADEFYYCDWEKLLPVHIARYILTCRKTAANERKLKRFVCRWARVRQSRCFSTWISNVLLRKKARSILDSLVAGKWTTSVQHALNAFVRNSLAEICAIKVQSLYRRHLVFRSIRLVHRQRRGAIAFQSMFRAWKARQVYAYLRETRLVSAITIQQFRRAVISRRHFHKVFVTLIANERQRLRREELRRLESRKMESIVLIQSAWRRRQGVKEKNKLLYEIWRKQHEAEYQLKRRIQDRNRKVERHKFLVDEYYQRLGREHADTQRAQVDDKVRVEIHRRRRARAVQKWHAKYQNTIDEEENAASTLRYSFNMEWNTKIEDELKRLRQHMLLTVLSDTPAPVSQRFPGLKLNPQEARQAALDTFKALQKKAKKDDEYFEDEMGSMMAKEMIVTNYVKKYEDILIKQRDTAKEEMDQGIERKKQLGIQSREQYLKNAQEKLVLKLQCIWRSHKARRELMELASQYILKRLDPGTKNTFYVNVKTMQSSWKKPLYWLNNDVEFVDEWVTCYDDEGDVYYLNPFQKRMEYAQLPDVG